jgi:hypothetical protein
MTQKAKKLLIKCFAFYRKLGNQKNGYCETYFSFIMEELFFSNEPPFISNEPFSKEGKKEKNTLTQERKWDHPPKSSF